MVELNFKKTTSLDLAHVRFLENMLTKDDLFHEEVAPFYPSVVYIQPLRVRLRILSTIFYLEKGLCDDVFKKFCERTPLV